MVRATLFLAFMLGAIVVLYVFAAIYHSLGGNNFMRVIDNDKSKSLSFSEALSVSLSTQSLLGDGAIVPVHAEARTWMGIQTMISFLGLAAVASNAFKPSPRAYESTWY